MKRSIRIRFTMIFIGLMAGIFVGIWCVNNWMLEWFYINQKVDALQLGYTRMNELVMERWESGGSINDEFITDSYGEEVQTPALAESGRSV